MNDYTTTDFALAAYLTTKGHTLLELTDDPGRAGRKIFHFLDCDSLREHIEGFQEGTARVEPKQFNNELRTIKSRIVGNY